MPTSIGEASVTQNGIAGRNPLITVRGMGDGRTFDQAVRALDKFIAEHTDPTSDVPDPNSPIRRAYERLLAGTGDAYSRAA
jgi:hypothetical protein